MAKSAQVQYRRRQQLKKGLKRFGRIFYKACSLALRTAMLLAILLLLIITADNSDRIEKQENLLKAFLQTLIIQQLQEGGLSNPEAVPTEETTKTIEI